MDPSQEPGLPTTMGSDGEDKMVLPVEMASMVPLRSIVGKLIRKCYDDLTTLTDTLPSTTDLDRKRKILHYAASVRKQFLKLYVIVKWAENAKDVQMCQNIMAFLANQNKIFQDTVDYLYKIYAELPGARVRNFDILTAVDVLTTGTYQRMPSKLQDIIPPSPLTDQQVLETFKQMNDTIRLRMLTTEVLPSPMQKYRIENEFEVSLTLKGPHREWCIVSLDILVKSAQSGDTADVGIILNELKPHLRMNAQMQLDPRLPLMQDSHLQAKDMMDISSTGISSQTEGSVSLFFPLVNLYDYLHMCCLNMQLEILHMQANNLRRTRWINQLDAQMNSSRTSLALMYWGSESPVARWGCAMSNDELPADIQSTRIELSVSDEAKKQQLSMSIIVRDELQGLIQKAGIGASVRLAKADPADKPKIVSALKYPKNRLQVIWSGESYQLPSQRLLNPSNLNVERLVKHITTCHSRSILDKFRKQLQIDKTLLEENGVRVIESFDRAALTSEDTKAGKTTEDEDDDYLCPLRIQYREVKQISIDIDTRTGYIKTTELGRGHREGDEIVSELEERLNRDPKNISKFLIVFRSKVVVREIVSLAKQLNLQPFDISQMLLRKEEQSKLFSDLQISLDPTDTLLSGQSTSLTNSRRPITKQASMLSSVFLQFLQFEDWYLVFGITKDKFQIRLCCLKKIKNDRDNELFHEIVELIPIDYDALRSDSTAQENVGNNTENQKRRLTVDETASITSEAGLLSSLKRRKTFGSVENSRLLNDPTAATDAKDIIDSLSIDLRLMAKLDSFARAYITNKKVELQLRALSLHYQKRPLLKSLWAVTDAQAANHPAADKMEVICVSQKDILRACLRRQTGLFSSAAEAWIRKLLRRMQNHVVMRASGWWSCGRNECYVVIQDRIDWKSMALTRCEVNDHILLDKTTGILSFTYTEVDSCIQRFLVDWERIFMMGNLARQVSSAWLQKFKRDLVFDAFDLQALRFTYGEDEYTCSIQWEVIDNSRRGQYKIQLGTKSKSNGRARNPHTRVTVFLQDQLNTNHDLIYFIQILFQTLPLFQCLEHLEELCARHGDFGRVSIIPRAADSVRLMFSPSHALDIRFSDATTVTLVDPAYHRHLGPSSFDDNAMVEVDNAKIKVAPPDKLATFTRFEELLQSVEQWIFTPPPSPSSTFRPHPSLDSGGDRALAVPHGLVCSVSLCPQIFSQLAGYSNSQS